MIESEHIEYLEYLKYNAKIDPSGKPERRIGAFDMGLYITNALLAEKYRDKLISKGWLKE